MMGTSPPVAGQDNAVDALFRLLDVLADPAKARAMLEELRSASLEASEAERKALESLNVANSALDESKKRQEQLYAFDEKTQGMRRDVEITIKIVNDDKKKLNEDKKQLDLAIVASNEREAALIEREAFLSRGEKALANRAAELDVEMLARTQRLEERESAVAEKEKETVAMLADYNKKVEGLRRLVA